LDGVMIRTLSKKERKKERKRSEEVGSQSR
jgi:hypothetical protein